MQRLARAAAEAEDTLLIYYAGHGILGWNDELYLTVWESDDHQIAGTAVPFGWVRSTMQDSPAAVRIIVLDCCFSGAAIGAMSTASAAVDMVHVEGTTILTSSSATRISHSIPGERYTAFTGELIRLLTENGDRELCIDDVYRPLSAAMARRSLPKPKIVIGETAGDLVLHRRAVHRLQRNVALSGEAHGESASDWPYALRAPVAYPWQTNPAEQTFAGYGAPLAPRPEPHRPQVPDTTYPARGDAVRLAAIIVLASVALFFGIGFVAIAVTAADGKGGGTLGGAIAALIFLAVLTGTCGFFFVFLLRRFMARLRGRKSSPGRPLDPSSHS